MCLITCLFFSSWATTWFSTAIEWREGTLEGKLCCNNRRYTVRDRAVLMKEHTFVSAQLYRRLESIFHSEAFICFFVSIFAASSLYLGLSMSQCFALYFSGGLFDIFWYLSIMTMNNMKEFLYFFFCLLGVQQQLIKSLEV